MITKQDVLTETEFHAEGGCSTTVEPRGGVKNHIEVWRVNGAVKTWKRRDDVIMPVKWGMGYGRGSYSYVRWPQDAHLWHTRAACPVLANTAPERSEASLKPILNLATRLDPEERAYNTYAGGHSRSNRHGRAIYPDGTIRAVVAGVADTFFSIPAHGRVNGKYVSGFLTIDEYGLHHFSIVKRVSGSTQRTD